MNGVGHDPGRNFEPIGEGAACYRVLPSEKICNYGSTYLLNIKVLYSIT